MASDRRVDRSRPRLGTAVDERQILAVQPPFGDQLPQRSVHPIALGDDEQTVPQKVRAIIGPGQIPASEAAAQSAWNKLRDGDAPTPDELQALELVIRMMRRVGRGTTKRRGLEEDHFLIAIARRRVPRAEPLESPGDQVDFFFGFARGSVAI